MATAVPGGGDPDRDVRAAGGRFVGHNVKHLPATPVASRYRPGPLGMTAQLRERHELTVTELCAVLQLPQSTVNRHLKTLADGDWVPSRRDGTARYYGLSPMLVQSVTRLWPLIREQACGSAAIEQDARRDESVLHEREYQRHMGHVWLGFAESQMRKWLDAAGFRHPERALHAHCRCLLGRCDHARRPHGVVLGAHPTLLPVALLRLSVRHLHGIDRGTHLGGRQPDPAGRAAGVGLSQPTAIRALLQR